MATTENPSPLNFVKDKLNRVFLTLPRGALQYPYSDTNPAKPL